MAISLSNEPLETPAKMNNNVLALKVRQTTAGAVYTSFARDTNLHEQAERIF